MIKSCSSRKSTAAGPCRGGWVDVNQSICDNIIKEAREEAGLDVVPTRLVAIHDRNRHNTPLYAYGIAKVFMLCEVIGGHFSPNIETSESAYFSLDNLHVFPSAKTPKNRYGSVLPPIKIKTGYQLLTNSMFIFLCLPKNLSQRKCRCGTI